MGINGTFSTDRPGLRYILCIVPSDRRYDLQQFEKGRMTSDTEELQICSGVIRVVNLVSPGAATDGVAPIFFLKKTDLFCSSLSLDFTRVSPPWRVSPRTFLDCPTSFCPLFFCKFSHIFFIRVSPPGGCHPGRSAPPPVTPLQI